MVCIPCIVIPALLWVYYRFLRPFMGPVLDKLDHWLKPWLEPLKTKFLGYGACPIGGRNKQGVIKTKPTASAPPDEDDQDIDIDSEEKLHRVVESGSFGASVADLRKRPVPSAPAELGSGDQ
ncbi:UPF0729 protein C18orf32 homolog isoform X2 [Paramacrobiotus metropolitanus]|uniref:UPF0729 protein C18orf32 homolog isoform X2 n=1 Tax=Paramacrobiotus metropolitanus TaxID=2943436 RepID=UPI0024456EB7|nr:UPF0729 protein C18orf32 homolog isoform X2 [Paramacrobiotus metropolitanus]